VTNVHLPRSKCCEVEFLFVPQISQKITFLPLPFDLRFRYKYTVPAFLRFFCCLGECEKTFVYGLRYRSCSWTISTDIYRLCDEILLDLRLRLSPHCEVESLFVRVKTVSYIAPIVADTACTLPTVAY